MKKLDSEIRVPAGDAADAWVQEGLRALRQQEPSDESKRAMLAQLGIGADVALAQAQAPAKPSASSLWRWLLAGVLLGVIALVLQRWLG